MSQYKVKKLDHPIHCTVEVPGSKSITNRALLRLRASHCPFSTAPSNSLITVHTDKRKILLIPS